MLKQNNWTSKMLIFRVQIRFWWLEETLKQKFESVVLCFLMQRLELFISISHFSADWNNSLQPVVKYNPAQERAGKGARFLSVCYQYMLLAPAVTVAYSRPATDHWFSTALTGRLSKHDMDDIPWQQLKKTSETIWTSKIHIRVANLEGQKLCKTKGSVHVSGNSFLHSLQFCKMTGCIL